MKADTTDQLHLLLESLSQSGLFTFSLFEKELYGKKTEEGNVYRTTVFETALFSDF